MARSALIHGATRAADPVSDAGEELAAGRMVPLRDNREPGAKPPLSDRGACSEIRIEGDERAA
jgi:hypothetical protein